MKRLFYAANHMDDAEEISNQVHQSGINDHHFYVISRDKKGLKQHDFHGSPHIYKAHIITAKDRVCLFALIMAIVVAVTVITLFLNTDLINELKTTFTLSLAFIFIIFILFVLKYTGKSYDGCFIDMFERHTKDGEVVIIIDVARAQAHRIESIMNAHSKANFITDSTN